jgi:tetratricopeptide (TPR) repeat protein
LGALGTLAAASVSSIAVAAPFSFVQVAPTDPVKFLADTRRAQALIDEKKWAEAEPILRYLVAAHPAASGFAARVSNWGRLATVLREQGKCREAIPAYQRVIEMQGPGLSYLGWGNARYAMAACQLAIGDRLAALSTLHEFVQADRFLQRPSLVDDPAFAALRDDPRFRALVGPDRIVRAKGRVSGWRADIDYLSSEVARNTGAAPSAQFGAVRDKLKRDIPNLSDEAVVAGLGRMLASLHLGHTALWLGDPSAKTFIDYRQLPLRFYLFADGAFVTQDFTSATDLAGAQILKIGEMDVVDAVDRVRKSSSHQSESELIWIAPEFLIRPAVLKGLGIIDRSDRVELTVRARGGGERVVTLAPADEPDLGPLRNKLAPPPGVTPPRFLAKLKDEVHWFEPVSGADVLYVQVNNMRDDKDESLAEFGLRLRRELARANRSNLIIDLRNNNGGNSFQYVELLRTLVAYSAIDGNRVYALIGRNVYSAAGNFTTDLERLVKPVFVGEPTGQMGNQAGDESMFVLPYSGLTGAVSGVRWQLSHPWDKRNSVAPDVPVAMSSTDYFAGRDPVMAVVMRLIAENPRSK